MRSIITLNRKARYVEARRIAKEFGGLLRHAVADTCLVSGHWEKFGLPRKILVDEILACPAIDGVFRTGEDVVDSRTCARLPADYVPEPACGRKGVGLYVIPREVKEERGIVTVHAREVVLLEDLAQAIVATGKLDWRTRIPSTRNPEYSGHLLRRTLWRARGAGVSTIMRETGATFGDRRMIYAANDPRQEFDIVVLQQ